SPSLKPNARNKAKPPSTVESAFTWWTNCAPSNSTTNSPGRKKPNKLGPLPSQPHHPNPSAPPHQRPIKAVKCSNNPSRPQKTKTKDRTSHHSLQNPRHPIRTLQPSHPAQNPSRALHWSRSTPTPSLRKSWPDEDHRCPKHGCVGSP